MELSKKKKKKGPLLIYSITWIDIRDIMLSERRDTCRMIPSV